MVVIVSDLFDDLEAITTSIMTLKHAGHELIVFQICDRDECEFPFNELVQFVDYESGDQLTLDAEVYRSRYLRQFDQFVDEVRRTCQRASVDFLRVITDQSFDQVIGEMLSIRSRSGSSIGY